MTYVLHIGKYYPPDNGGIESVTASLARGSVASGIETTVVCFGDHATKNEDDAGVNVLRHTQTLKVASQPLGLSYVIGAISKSRNAQIVHVHVPNMLAALIVAMLGRQVQVVVHWHSDVVGKGLLARLLRPLEQAMLRRANRIIATSAAYAQGSVSLSNHLTKLAVVPLGVPDANQAATNAMARSAALPTHIRDFVGQHRMILCVGRLVPYKGYGTMITAVSKIASDAVVVIVGSGPLQPELQAQIDAAGLRGRVMLAGRVHEENLELLRGTASVFCMPSTERSEAFGVALIEAMAAGLPLVATRIEGSGVPWVNQHGETGLNVKPGDPEELAWALDSLLQDESLRKRLAKGARQRYVGLFTERAMVASTLAVYKELLMPNDESGSPIVESSRDSIDRSA